MEPTYAAMGAPGAMAGLPEASAPPHQMMQPPPIPDKQAGQFAAAPMQPQMMMAPARPPKPIEAYDGNLECWGHIKGQRSEVFVEAYKRLGGWDESIHIQKLVTLEKYGAKMKRIKIVLRDGSFRAEAGALHYMLGNIKISADIGGFGGLMKKHLRAKMTGETTVKPLYEGSGVVYLEPTWSHYQLVYLNNEQLVVEKGMYFASESSVEIGVFSEAGFLTTSRTANDGEHTTRFKTRCTGTGWVVLDFSVPPSEVQKMAVRPGQVLRVDGYFGVLRKGDIKMSVNRATSSRAGSKASGEGFLVDFEGNGEVWLTPTIGDY